MAQKFNGKPGDLIEIFRGPYQHWAVYIGKDEVIHLDTEGGQSSGSLESLSSSDGKVKRERFADVVSNHRYRINNLLDNSRKARDPSIIVKEACAMVGRELEYNVDTYNCEHFATEMRYGKINVKPGDLIEISRGSYQHWAVYIGENEVVHLVREGGRLLSAKAEVRHEKFTDVVAISHFKVNNLLDEKYKPCDPSIIVKEACAMVGRELTYGVVSYNSKHFAIEMRYGKAESPQFKGKPGDLIQFFYLTYQHWAVYIGENEVVHFTKDDAIMKWHLPLSSFFASLFFLFVFSIKHTGGDSSGWLESRSSSTGKVKREKLTNLLSLKGYCVNNLQDEEYDARDPSIIVEEACEMVGSDLPYDGKTNNSEHFAIEMRYGKAESRQFKGNKGDLIEIFNGTYKQWAVYIGENEVVILVKKGDQSPGWLESLRVSTGKVKREKLAAVVGNHRCQVNNLLDNKRTACDPSVIVKKAREMVGCNLPYAVFTYNCKDFAIEMRYGEAESGQVKNNAWIASVAAAVVVLVTGGSIVALGVTAAGAFVVCAALIHSLSSS